MLDHFSHVTDQWKSEYLEAGFEQHCEDREGDPAHALHKILGSDTDPDEPSDRVASNVPRARIRMLLVTDSIPPEL